MSLTHNRIPYPEEKSAFIKKATTFANSYEHFGFYQNNDIQYPHGGFENILAIGAKELLTEVDKNIFERIQEFTKDRFAFGYLGYDLKNQIERLSSSNKDSVRFHDAFLFVPEYIVMFYDDGFEYIEGSDLTEKIQGTEITSIQSSFGNYHASVGKQDYLRNVESLRKHIYDGDCYEINYCQEFHGEIDEFNPVQTYWQLNEISPKPFSCLLKNKGQYVISASPERFLKKSGDKLISQPIKGTRPRGSSQEEDELLRVELRNDEKEIAENMMIVDLVRNDLARSSISGSVEVEELFGIYTFQQVHQMISTVVSEMKADTSSIDAIKNAFPMGSMTGAPKVKVMELIEQYENTKRGPFSGAAGYFTPKGNFDLNVLIRSLFVNTSTKTYSFQVGGAITYDSQPEREYEECMVKAKAILELIK